MVDISLILAAILAKVIPSTFEQIIWWGMGGGIARALFKKLDWDIKNSQPFKDLPLWKQNVVARVLDATHHWWIGGLMMIYLPAEHTYWFGAGVLVDDLPDLYKRITNMIKDIAKYLSKS